MPGLLACGGGMQLDVLQSTTVRTREGDARLMSYSVSVVCVSTLRACVRSWGLRFEKIVAMAYYVQTSGERFRVIRPFRVCPVLG